MAFKKYGYYLKGNKIALIEQSDVTASGNLAVAHCSGISDSSSYTTKNTCEAAGGQWIPSSSGGVGTYSEYASPTESVTGGLEIQYAYSPTFNLQSTGTEGNDFHRFLGWGSDGINLLLFTFGAAAAVDLSSLFAADDWIYISGSGRWSGLHQVKSTGGTRGILTLKTKANIPSASLSTTVNFTTSETITGQTATEKMDIEAYKDATATRSTRYIFIDLADKAVNSGLFSLSSNATSGVLTANKRIVIDADGDYTEEAAAMEVESSTNDAVIILSAFYEQISVYEGVEVMQGASAETFELDISRYQANAIVYYLKAKMAEDTGNMELREFFMREFKRQLEKGVSALKRGPYIVQGFKEMR
jgi:hypothetical protein